MAKMLLWLLLIVLVIGIAAVTVSVRISQPLFDETLDASLFALQIAPPETALTFARDRKDGRPRVLLVTGADGDHLSALDLSAQLHRDETDPVRLLAAVGYDTLAQLASRVPERVTVELGSLDVPFDAPEQNIGIGANYREHARESRIDEEPFVFPKVAWPTPANSDISRSGSTLLDYEAELGLVALAPIGPQDTPATMGLVLCNEMTDRWALVRNLRFGTPMGTTGFADGKSREGFAPVGPLLVVPRDLDRFYETIRLSLYVNGRLRQRVRAGEMMWSPREILRETFRRADWIFHYGDGTLRLLGGGGEIGAGTLIFSGTPAGVIFKPANLWNPWVYLRPGDEIVVQADHLGTLRNRIVE